MTWCYKFHWILINPITYHNRSTNTSSQKISERIQWFQSHPVIFRILLKYLKMIFFVMYIFWRLFETFLSYSTISVCFVVSNVCNVFLILSSNCSLIYLDKNSLLIMELLVHNLFQRLFSSNNIWWPPFQKKIKDSSQYR
jgi:hypothetical protein